MVCDDRLFEQPGRQHVRHPDGAIGDSGTGTRSLGQQREHRLIPKKGAHQT